MPKRQTFMRLRTGGYRHAYLNLLLYTKIKLPLT